MAYCLLDEAWNGPAPTWMRGLVFDADEIEAAYLLNDEVPPT